MSAKAQKLKFDNYTSKDGLISDDVYTVFQDKKGYIWLFTDYGTMKYNGKKFEQVLKNLPFNESFIYSYYQNSKGQLWIANSNARIYEVKNDSAFIVKGTEKISEKLKNSIAEIFQLYVDDSLDIYAVTKFATFKFLKSKNYQEINLSSEIIDDEVAYNVILKKENLLPIISEKIVKLNSAYFVNHKKIKVKIITNQQKKRIVDLTSSVLAGPKFFKQFGEVIYVCFYDKIIKIKSDNSSVVIPLQSLITNFVKDENGHLWVGCVNNGLFEINTNDSIINHYLVDKTVNDILIDSQNEIWVTTAGFGLYHCKGANIYYHEKTEGLGLPINFMKKIDNKIFASNNQGDLYIIDEKGRENVIKNTDIKSDPLDIIKYHSLFLISYRHKTEYIDINKGIVKVAYPPLKNFFAPYKYSFIDKDTLLLVKRNGLLKVYNDSILKKIDFKIKLFDAVYREKKIFIATNEGIYELMNNKPYRPEYLNLSKNSIISKIVKGKFGELWFCSKGFGLFKLTNENKLTHYTIENGLPSNIINDISFNTNNGILLSTNIGLFQSSKYKKWINIYPEQVSSAIEFKNTIYLNTKDGLILIKNSSLNDKLPVYFNLSSVMIDGVLTNYHELKKLKHNQNNIEFNFDIISYSSRISDMIYQLSGSKNKIGISKNQQLVFQNLAPGTYTLSVSLVSDNIKSNSIVIPFVISPVFWQTMWFKVICFFTIVLICFIIGWQIFKYYKDKEDRKNRAERLITEYKLIALKAQINPHFMSNCLTAIQQLIITDKLDEANQYIAKFSFLVRQVLNFSSKKMVSLKEELDITALNIELEQLRFENKIEFEIEIEEAIDLKNIGIPPLMFQPIIENAIWHGLLPLKRIRKGLLKLSITVKDDMLHVVIKDNGVGRHKKKETIGNLKKSKGIEIVNQRIQSLNNLHNTISGKLLFEDLYDGAGNSCGSCVTIILPIFKLQEYDEDKNVSN